MLTRDRLLADVVELHEDFLKQMMDLSRQVTDLEDKILRDDRDGSTTAIPTVLEVLLVDDDSALSQMVHRELTSDKGWKVRSVHTDGEALDGSAHNSPHVLVAKQTLPDLPVSMVVKTLKAASPDLVALVFRPPGAAGDGEVQMVENSKVVTLIPSFSKPEQLLAALEEVRDALRRKARERRYLAVFRKRHFTFLKRFQQMRQRLAPES